MNKLSRLFVRRLERIARREARRNAHRNGLLHMKIVEIGGHVMRCYAPAFDTSRLSGDCDRDLAWLRRNFGGYLLPPPHTSDIVVTEGRPLALAMLFPSGGTHTGTGESISAADHAYRAYAVGLVARAGRSPLVSNIVAAIVLARAIQNGSMPFAKIARAAGMSAPVVSLHAPIAGFEQAMRRLIEVPGFIPGGAPNGIDGDYVFDDTAFAASEGTGRTYIQFIGDNVRRIGGAGLQRRLMNALTRDYPVVAISEKPESIPSEITIAADIDLATGWLDYAFIRTMIEAMHGAAGIAALEQWSNVYDAHYLTIDDVVLAFRPGRSANEVIAVLASLTERNRLAARDGGDADGDPASADTGKASKPKQGAAPSDKTSSGKDGGGGWKRDKPSGAEVIQPEPLDETDASGRPSLTVETLSGYGKAKTWALDLKVDLADYRAGSLAWADMSTKLLLHGAPGTGKTTFARALCNSLQVPLVVTSVSTWLQGGHLNDVIDKMAKTFAEARALAPSILFIDEIDGIGKRQPAEQEYADYWNTMVNKALELLDGAVKSEGLVIVGATNRPDQIDDAIKRSGRLETHIEIPMPDVATLAEIFAYHLGDDVAALGSEAGSTSTDAGERRSGDTSALLDVPSAFDGQATADIGKDGSGEARKGAAK
ncbi:ATP-binding protein [Neorhizobium galegae]|uniref:Putative ATP-dependent hydrolase protein n=1 Tax=Neorhizobium galegae bv. officinalis TaxID=323656 RepID=A0A0T7GV70_NEOGA|nr:ATP-binding protein [Neorhizobium galegae]CDZ51181.1 Putative ATP-dependent hydrolase protein [Neorhizobium galegae bv. officinalis]